MPLTAASNSNASGGILSGSGTSYFVVGSVVTAALGVGVAYTVWSRKRGGGGGGGNDLWSGAPKGGRLAGDGRGGKLGAKPAGFQVPPPPPGKPPKHAILSYAQWSKSNDGRGFDKSTAFSVPNPLRSKGLK